MRTRRTGREGLHQRVRQGERIKRARSRTRREAKEKRELDLTRSESEAITNSLATEASLESEKAMSDLLYYMKDAYQRIRSSDFQLRCINEACNGDVENVPHQVRRAVAQMVKSASGASWHNVEVMLSYDERAAELLSDIEEAVRDAMSY